jgi:hypothetical protein
MTQSSQNQGTFERERSDLIQNIDKACEAMYAARLQFAQALSIIERWDFDDGVKNRVVCAQITTVDNISRMKAVVDHLQSVKTHLVKKR